MNANEAQAIHAGSLVSYAGKLCRVNAVSNRGVGAPHFTLSYELENRPGEGWTSHELCAIADTSTEEPVTLGGWYRTADGGRARYEWRAGHVKLVDYER